jgi:uncharacterized protein
MQETVKAKGHENVQSTHKTTLEFTKEKELGKNGDCIIAVSADKACADFSEGFKEALRQGAGLKIEIESGGEKDTLYAKGSNGLLLDDEKETVIRKSDFISGRTLAINADKSSSELKKSLVAKLKKPGQEVTIVLTIETE